MTTALEKKITPAKKRLAEAIANANLRGHAYTCAVGKIGIELANIRHIHLSRRGGHEEGFADWLADESNWQLTRMTAYNYINCAANILRAAGWDVTLDNLHTYSQADIAKAEKATKNLGCDLKLGDMKKSLTAGEPDKQEEDDEDDSDEDAAKQLFLPLWNEARNMEHHTDDLHLLPLEDLAALQLDLAHAAKLAKTILTERRKK